MNIFLFIISGLLGGILGGMGMGGGTLLIPILTIFLGINQHTAQAVNLIAFIPMAIISIVIHLKNKLIKFDRILFIIIPGLITCAVGSYIAKIIEGETLSKIFGLFLIILSIFQIFNILKNNKK